MSQKLCGCLKWGDILGIVFVYLAMLQNDPSGYALHLNVNRGKWKGRKKCTLSLLDAWGLHSAFRKVLRCWRNPWGQVHDFLALPWVLAELLRAALQQDGEFTGHCSLAFDPPTALMGINFDQCRQSVGCFSLLFSFCYPFFLSCLSPVFSCHTISLQLKKYLSAYGLQERAC